jgi:class 3 adenylate cyclase
VFGHAGPIGAQQFVAFGDCVSIAERLVHRARAGEVILSIEVIKALGTAAQSLGARQLPPLELAKRAPIPLYGIVLETRLDFT